MNKPEKFWDRNANGYDKAEMKDKIIRMKILEKIKQYLQKQDTVLDYGCATGILANEIAGQVTRVTGIDISSAMIGIAQAKARELAIPNVEYSHSTLFDAQLKARSFDVVLGVYMLHLLDNMPSVLERIHELLKPGGLFISVTPCLGKKSVSGITLSLASKIGLIPSIQLLNVPDLETALTDIDLTILETTCIQRRGRQFFIVAKKR